MKGKSGRPPRRADRQTRYARLLGMGFCMAGFAAIALGWAGAARQACVDCQIPYLISGGAAGVALVAFGGALLLMAQMRTEARRIGARLEHLTGTITKTLVGTAGSSANGRVVAGRSTFHLPDCRLVKDKAGLDLLTVETARQNGLEPCRVCDPLHQDEGDADTRVAEPLQAEPPTVVRGDDRTEQIDLSPERRSHDAADGAIAVQRERRDAPDLARPRPSQPEGPGSEEPGSEPTSWWER
jgi:hypothetical protein